MPSKTRGRRGRRENSVSHGRLHRKKSANEGRHRESRKFSRRPGTLGHLFANAAGGKRVSHSCPATTAHGGLTAYFARPPVDLPIYPPLVDPFVFAVLALARVPDEAAKKGPCGERLARRNRATSAAARPGALRPSSAATVPDPTSNTPRDAPLMDRDEKEYSPSLGWKYGGGYLFAAEFYFSSLPGLTRQSIMTGCKVHGFTFLQANRAAHCMSALRITFPDGCMSTKAD